MKKFFITIALMMPMLVCAQKFAHVDSNDILANLSDVKTMQATLDSLQGQYENMFVTMREEYQRKLQDYQNAQATMTDVMRQMREQEIIEMENRIQGFSQTVQQDLQTKQRELFVPIQEKVQKSISKVAAQQQLTYVFEKGQMLFVSEDATDITPLVKKDLGIK